jgi:hypothetical protein
VVPSHNPSNMSQSPSGQIARLVRMGLPPTRKEVRAIDRIHAVLADFMAYARRRGVDVSTVADVGAAKISVGHPKMWISLSAMSGGPWDSEPALETALISKNVTNTNTFVTHIQTWDDMVAMFDYMINVLTTTMSPDFCTHIQHTVGTNQVTPTLVGCVIGEKYVDKRATVVTRTEDGSYSTYEEEWEIKSHLDLDALCEYLAKAWPPKRSRAKATRDRKKKRERFSTVK